MQAKIPVSGSSCLLFSAFGSEFVTSILAPRSGLLRPARGGGQVVKVPPNVEHLFFFFFFAEINTRCQEFEFEAPNATHQLQ